MKPKRDSQKSRVYRAEHMVIRNLDEADALVKLDLPELKVAVGRTWEALGMAHYQTPKVGWLPNRIKRVGAWYDFRSHEVLFMKDARTCCQMIVVHELLHGVMAPDVLAGRAAWHGPEFVSKYLAGVDRTMPFEVGQKLRLAFRHTKARSARS